MTLTTTDNKVPFLGDGSTTIFPYTFKIFVDADLQVFVDDVLQILTTDYTVTGAGLDAGGTVVFVTAPATPLSIIIRRNVPQTQDTDLVENAELPSESIEDSLDKVTMLAQQQEEILDRTPTLKDSTTLTGILLPDEVADGLIKWNAAANQLEAVAFSTLSTVVTAVSAFMETVLDDIDAAAASKTITDGALRLATLFPGWTSNLKITIAAGVFTVSGANGAALSTTNPGHIGGQNTTAGLGKACKVTANVTFKDDVHASSDLANLGFGLTKTVNWANDVPFFLYKVNRGNSDIDGNDGNSAMFISRDPRMTTTPAAADDIGDTDTIPVNDSKDVILLLGSFTVANYTSLPCQVIGAFRMQWSTATDDWTVQAISDKDGIGLSQVEKTLSTVYTFPENQNGAAGSSHLKLNGGASVPAFSTNIYRYTIDRYGYCTIQFNFIGDGGTDGSGAVTAQMSVPYKHALADTLQLATIRMNSSATGGQFVGASVGASSDDFDMTEAAGTPVQIADFGNGGRDIVGSLKYKAFD